MKIGLFILAVLACLVFNSMLNTLLPSLDAQIAVNQLADDEFAAINDTFVSQQDKVKTEAAFEAQGKVIELEAEALANKVRTIAQGKADAVEIASIAEAGAIAAVARATKEAGKDPLFIQIKQLEVETQRIGKWNGQYPTSLMTLGGTDSPNLLLNVPIGATTPH